MDISNDKRIELLRNNALEAKPNNISWKFNFEKGFLDSFHSEINTNCRYGAAVKHMLEKATPVIDENELIVGKPLNRILTQEEQTEWENIIKYSVPAKSHQDGQASHMAIDYDLLLKKGTTGIKNDILDKMNCLDISLPEDLEKYYFYKSAISSLEGLEKIAINYSNYALELATKCTDSTRKAELIAISNNCKNVPINPASTFYEAVQSVHFVTFCLSASVPGGLYQLGRPDRYLYDYYKKDIANGTLTKDFALLLICCISILYNEYIGSGLAVGYMVGGYDTNFNCNIDNELTYLFVESIRYVKMIYPGVGLCVNKLTDDKLLKYACDVLSEGHSHPALFNDDIIIKGLMHYGLPFNDAVCYIHSTCVEITPCSNSACWVASPYTNLPALLLDVMYDNEIDSFKELKKLYYDKLSNHIRNNLIQENKCQIERSLHFYDPLLSCFVNDCVDKGVDIEHGGARYNWIMPSFVGMANLVDSLYVIKELVFNKKIFTIEKLKDMLTNDFVGYKAEHMMILEKIAKYGNDEDDVDYLVNDITTFLSNECKKYTTYRGGKLIPSLFCWIMHEQFGTNTMATPDGRKKSFPLGDGSGPAQGREKNGPTASILSSTKWEHYPFIGGIAVNMKFSKKMFNKKSFEALSSLIKTYMERGGFELQINVLDKETLLAAQKNPENHKDLVVRIGGYSDFFVRLSPAMQQEVIERSEHIL